jgi:hypothetical protein
MTTPTYEKHTTHTDALDTLGTLIDDTQKRDAIHLAVEPAVAGTALTPGESVILDDDLLTAFGVPAGEGVGIVDPFIVGPVPKGAKFWLVVYPRQISSLRHVWEHPSFRPSGETGVPVAAKAASEAWLRTYFRDEFHIGDDDDDWGDGDTFESLVRKLADADDEYVVVLGSDASGTIPAEVYDHVAIYTGEPVARRAIYWSCSC